MQILPNQSWTLPTQDNGPGAGIANIGNVFGDPMQNALQKQKAAQLVVDATGRQQMGSLFAHPGAVDYNTAAAAIANNADPQKIGEIFRLTNALHGGVDDDLAARAGRGIGEAFGSTPLGMQREQAAKMAETQQAAQIAAAAQVRAAGLHSVQGLNPDGTIGWTNEGDIAAHQTPQGMQPLVGTDMVKAAIAAHGLLPQQGGAPAPAAPAHNWGPAHAGGSPSGPIVADPSWTPPTDPAAAPANPGPAMSPDQRQFVLGADGKTKLEYKKGDPDLAGHTHDNIFNPDTGAVTPVPSQDGAASVAGPAPSVSDAMGGLHGDEFLATIPPEIVPMVKAIASGDILPPPATTRQGQPNPLLRAVTQYDPTFDASNAQARYAMAKAYTSGQQGTAISSAGAALGHLGELLTQIPALGNANSSLPGNDLYNSVKNAAKGGAASAPLAAYDQINHRLNGELEKYYTATGGTKEERKAGEALQSRNASPSELYASAVALTDMLQGKSSQLKAQYGSVMGANAKPIPTWSPEAQATLAKIQQMKDNFAKTGSYTGVGTLPGVTTKEAPVGAPAQSPVGTVKQWNGKSYARTPGDEYDQNSWREIPGGK